MQLIKFSSNEHLASLRCKIANEKSHKETFWKFRAPASHMYVDEFPKVWPMLQQLVMAAFMSTTFCTEIPFQSAKKLEGRSSVSSHGCCRQFDWICFLLIWNTNEGHRGLRTGLIYHLAAAGVMCCECEDMMQMGISHVLGQADILQLLFWSNEPL